MLISARGERFHCEALAVFGHCVRMRCLEYTAPGAMSLNLRTRAPLRHSPHRGQATQRERRLITHRSFYCAAENHAKRP